MGASIAEIARHLQCPFHGDGSLQLLRISNWEEADRTSLIYCEGSTRAARLPDELTAGCIITTDEIHRSGWNTIVSERPKLDFSRAARLLHPRPAGAFLFLAALSTLRWNVLASYLDDAMIHIFCLWIVLLPVGSTLNVPDLLASASGNLTDPSGDLSTGPGSAAAAGTPVLDTWLAATVPGTAPRAFIANMALVYLVAGLYKFTSPMWRDGSAMHAALRMPIARAPGFWTLRWRTPLRLVTWAALVMEPFFALIFVLPTGSPLKWPLVAGAVVFHLGIAFTLKIPYSNAAMASALPLALGPEIMQMGLALPPPPRMPSPGLAPSEIVALTLVALIVIMLVWEAANTGRRPRERYSSTQSASPW